MALLDGLERVDWSKLHHAYGPALDVPLLLRALVDEKVVLPAKSRTKTPASAFEDATYQLWGNVFHQGSVWQASAHVIPFLVEILRDGPDRVELRQFLVSYLHHLAMGYPSDIFPIEFDPDVEYASVAGQKDPGTVPTYGPDGSNPGIWHRDCYEGVERSLGEVVRLFDDTDDETALEAIAMVTWFPRQKELLVPRLVRALEASTGMRAGTAIVSLAHLAPREGLERSSALVRSADPLVAMHAACARVIGSVRTASPGIDEDTLAVMIGSGVDGELHTPLTGSLQALVGRCLGMLPPEHTAIAVTALDKLMVATPKVMARHSLAASLLSLIFRGEQAPAASKNLSPIQRRGLESIRDHGPFKMGDAIYANFSSLLRNYGLPTSKEALTAWLHSA